MQWVNIIFVALAALLLVPVTVLCAECLAALLPGRRCRATPGEASCKGAALSAEGLGTYRPGVVILIPAHNEESVLAETLQSLMPQLSPGDEVVVVADNCDDATAEIARGFGCTVLERTDAVNRGKGFALDCGVRHLRSDPPAVVVMMDADCTVRAGSVDALVEQVIATGRPAQACYVMEQARNASPRDLVSALAFLVKNGVRPRGLGRLNLPCLLTGTGMAFPWHVISQAELASGNIVEDMQLGLDLAMEGHAPLFCDGAHVTGRLPTQQKIAYGQRTRWEHGHLQTLLTQVPRMFKAAIIGRRLQAFSLAVELSVPPLALLMMALIGALSLATSAAIFGASGLPAALLAGGITMIGGCLFGAWAKFGRQTLPLTALLAAPFYMAWKVPMYLAFLFKRHTEWNRTARIDVASVADTATVTVSVAEAPLVPALAGMGLGLSFELPPAGVGIGRDFNVDRPILPSRMAPGLSSLESIDLGGMHLHAVTVRQCVEHIFGKLGERQGGMVVRPTLDHLRWCAKDPQFADLIASAELIVAEGIPLVWASQMQGTPLPSRVSGSELVWSVIAAASGYRRSLFMLGDDFEITTEAAGAVGERFEDLKLAGTYNAPDGFDSDHEAFQHVLTAVCRANPDVVLVALGTPKQERLIAKLRQSEKLAHTWWLAVGNSFQFLCDDARRAPTWLRSAGMDWPEILHGDSSADGAAAAPNAGPVPFAASLLGGAAVKRLARILNKAAPQENILRKALEGGLEKVAIEGGAPHAEAKVDTNGSERGSAADAGDSIHTGPSIVYQSFIKGFMSEMACGESNDTNYGVVVSENVLKAEDHRAGPLGRLRAVVLLGGSIRPSRLSTVIGRSLLDLPLEDGRSMLWHWRDHAMELRRFIGLDQLPVRCLVDGRSVQPTIPVRGTNVRVTVERDASRYRGTAGVLRDLTVAAGYGDDDYILVANAAQCLLSPLSELAAALAAPKADVSLIAHQDGTPSGVMLMRCAALKTIAAEGYVDMKEQALPVLARQFHVQHLTHAYPTGLPIRALEEYVTAVQHRYRQRLGRPVSNDPFAEDCRPSFAIIEEGAQVHPTAKVHDSVILAGARVDEGALVIRSVICPGLIVRAGEHIVDQLVIRQSTPAAVAPAA